MHCGEVFKNFIILSLQGGCFTGTIVQGFLKHLKIATDHISIRTSSYTTEGKQKEIRVHGLEYLVKNATRDSKVLIVDDIFDTGRSIQAVLEKLKRKMKLNCPTSIKIATVFYKPKNNKTLLKPDYWCVETDQWIVLPHEYDDLTREEIKQMMGSEIANLFPSNITKEPTTFDPISDEKVWSAQYLYSKSSDDSDNKVQMASKSSD